MPHSVSLTEEERKKLGGAFGSVQGSLTQFADQFPSLTAAQRGDIGGTLSQLEQQLRQFSESLGSFTGEETPTGAAPTTGRVPRFTLADLGVTGSPLDTARQEQFAPGGIFAERGALTAAGEETIRQAARRRAQATLDSINQVFDVLVGREEEAGVERAGRTRAIAAASGTLGSSFGEAARGRTEQLTGRNIQAIQAERGLRIQAVFADIDQRVFERAKAERERRQKSAEEFITFLKESQAKTRSDIVTIAQGGINLEDLPEEDFKNLLKLGGFNNSFELEAFYNTNLPANLQVQFLDPEVIERDGNAFVRRIGFDPRNPGHAKTQEFDTGIKFEDFKATTTDFDQFIIAPDGTPLFISKERGEAKIAPGFGTGELAKPPEVKAPTTFEARAGLVGLSPQQQQDVFVETEPQQWFIDRETKKEGRDLANTELSTRWNDLKKQAIGAAQRGGEDVPDEVTGALNQAREAINLGADSTAVRQRFITTFPDFVNLYDRFFQLEIPFTGF